MGCGSSKPQAPSGGGGCHSYNRSGGPPSNRDGAIGGPRSDNLSAHDASRCDAEGMSTAGCRSSNTEANLAGFQFGTPYSDSADAGRGEGRMTVSAGMTEKQKMEQFAAAHFSPDIPLPEIRIEPPRTEEAKDDEELPEQVEFHAFELQPSVQSEGFVSASFIRDYPELAAVAAAAEPEPSAGSRFMSLVPGDGPTPEQMWAQLGADVMMEFANGGTRDRGTDDDNLTFS